MKLDRLQGLIKRHVQCQRADVMAGTEPPEVAAQIRREAAEARDKLYTHIRELEHLVVEDTIFVSTRKRGSRRSRYWPIAWHATREAAEIYNRLDAEDHAGAVHSVVALGRGKVELNPEN